MRWCVSYRILGRNSAWWYPDDAMMSPCWTPTWFLISLFSIDLRRLWILAILFALVGSRLAQFSRSLVVLCCQLLCAGNLCSIHSTRMCFSSTCSMLYYTLSEYLFAVLVDATLWENFRHLPIYRWCPIDESETMDCCMRPLPVRLFVR